MKTNEPMIVDDYSSWTKRNPSQVFDQVKAALAVPLTIRREVAGIIFFGATDPVFRFATDAEILLNEFASLASIAIDNARIHNELQSELEERKRSETQALRYRKIIERTKDIIIIFNSEGRIVDANQAALSSYGYSLEELRNAREGVLRAPEYKEQINQFIKDALVRNLLLETMHIRKDGRQFPVEVATGLIDLEDGPGFVSIVRDISERKDAENELHRKMKELAEALEDLKKTQNQMIQQEKLAGIGQLAAGVAHEINNPLGFVISNFTTLHRYIQEFLTMLAAYRNFLAKVSSMTREELLMEITVLVQMEEQKQIDFLGQDVECLLNESKNGLDRITRIVKGLHSFSRMEMQDVFVEYDLNEGVESSLVIARNEVKYNADVETDLGHIPKIFASAGQINQVLLNIIVNAAQAIKSVSKERRGIIRIKTFVEDNQIGCSIYNDGPPIPPGVIERVFEPFFTTKDVGHGTGLGLSISYDIIVNLHHGKFFVVSSEAEGTTFTFLLPMTTAIDERR